MPGLSISNVSYFLGLPVLTLKCFSINLKSKIFGLCISFSVSFRYSEFFCPVVFGEKKWIGLLIYLKALYSIVWKKTFGKNIPKKLLMIGLLFIPFITSNPVFASPWYQERDGIFGEIKFAEFCNWSTGVRSRVIAEAGSRTNRVYRVDFKVNFS
jgi:hypothetical protein